MPLKLRERMSQLPREMLAELDRAADALVPWIDRLQHGACSLFRQARTEVRTRDQLYVELGRRTHELLSAGEDRIRHDARVLELLASLARRDAEARAASAGARAPGAATE